MTFDMVYDISKACLPGFTVEMPNSENVWFVPLKGVIGDEEEHLEYMCADRLRVASREDIIHELRKAGFTHFNDREAGECNIPIEEL